MTSDLSLLGPELAVVAALLSVLAVDVAWGGRPGRRGALLWLAAVGLVVALGLVVAAPVATDRLLFGMMAADGFARFFRGLFLVSALLAVAFAALSGEVAEHRIGEYLALVLTLTVGLGLLASAQHLLLVYLGIELVSVPSYVLAGFRRGDRASSEAALKYVIFGGVASGLMLYGLSWLYGLTGTLDLGALGARLPALGQGGWELRVLLTVGALGAFAGFAYKVAAVPFHMWCPDVYEGAPTPFVAFLSVAPKAAGLAALFRFFVVGFAGAPTWPSGADFPWPLVLGLLSIATMTLGNVVAIVQDNVKRMLAYSSIAHAGYMLMAVAVGTQEGAAAVMFYLAVYLLMNFGAFLAVIAVRERTGSEAIAAYRGLGATSPLVALCLAVFLFSLTGVPPFAGFLGKFYLFVSVLHTGQPFFALLAVVGALNSAVSLYYYARLLKVMYLEGAAAGAGPLPVARGARALLAALAVPTLVLGVYWAPLAELVAASGGLGR